MKKFDKVTSTVRNCFLTLVKHFDTVSLSHGTKAVDQVSDSSYNVMNSSLSNLRKTNTVEPRECLTVSPTHPLVHC